MNELVEFSLFYQVDRHYWMFISINFLWHMNYLISPTHKINSHTKVILCNQRSLWFLGFYTEEDENHLELILWMNRMKFHLTSFLKGKVNPVYSLSQRAVFGEVHKSLYSANLEFSFIKSMLTQPIILQNVGLWRWARYFSSDLNLLSFSVNFFTLTGLHRARSVAAWRLFLRLLRFIKAVLTNPSNELAKCLF